MVFCLGGHIRQGSQYTTYSIILTTTTQHSALMNGLVSDKSVYYITNDAVACLHFKLHSSSGRLDVDIVQYRLLQAVAVVLHGITLLIEMPFKKARLMMFMPPCEH